MLHENRTMKLDYIEFRKIGTSCAIGIKYIKSPFWAFFIFKINKIYAL